MSKTLVVIDDAVIIREMIKDAVGSAGWTVVGEAANGQEGIDRYEQFRPTAVTLDLVMPQYDGLHALRGIRALDPTAQVLVVSALDQTAVLKDAFKMGAADFILKPFDPQQLVDSLERLVQGAM